MVGFLLPTEGREAQHPSTLSLVNVPSARGAHARPSQVAHLSCGPGDPPLLVRVL